jgi:hypothetical protein
LSSGPLSPSSAYSARSDLHQRDHAKPANYWASGFVQHDPYANLGFLQDLGRNPDIAGLNEVK